MPNDELAERVVRGADLLDGQVEDWPMKIDLQQLRMADPCYCVLGQLYGIYSNGLAELGLFEGGPFGFEFADGDSDRLARDAYGFVTSGEYDRYWARLNAAWLAEIKRRRQAPNEKPAAAE